MINWIKIEPEIYILPCISKKIFHSLNSISITQVFQLPKFSLATEKWLCELEIAQVGVIIIYFWCLHISKDIHSAKTAKIKKEIETLALY